MRFLISANFLLCGVACCCLSSSPSTSRSASQLVCAFERGESSSSGLSLSLSQYWSLWRQFHRTDLLSSSYVVSPSPSSPPPIRTRTGFPSSSSSSSSSPSSHTPELSSFWCQSFRSSKPKQKDSPLKNLSRHFKRMLKMQALLCLSLLPGVILGLPRRATRVSPLLLPPPPPEEALLESCPEGRRISPVFIRAWAEFSQWQKQQQQEASWTGEQGDKISK